MEIESKYKVIAGIEFISAGALIVFWLGYYTIGFIPVAIPTFYAAFQSAMPLLDICLALALIIAGLRILKKDKRGMLLSNICAAVFVFLGIAGLNLKLASGIYVVSMVSMLSSGFVNLWCVVFGIYIFLKLREKESPKKSNPEQP